MTASSLLLARRTVNELGEAVETRALTPSERRPQDGDVLQQKGFDAQYEIQGHCSLKGGWYWTQSGSATIKLWDWRMAEIYGFYYLSRFDGEPVAVELYPPRPMTTAERLPKKGDVIRDYVWNQYEAKDDVPAADGWNSFYPYNRKSGRKQKDTVAIGYGSICRTEQYAAMYYVSRADGGPVTVSTRPQEEQVG